ncbi:hypothetical protein IW146_004136 [Coemansia sp. RSA 922]|nr:hypothetical protein H4S04_002912 [Coemansia sp. S16]KAJ2113080.1 hypothetical protein IW146_004136 [Coemansia sp. RSA 922]KAJ2340829.1 hypothetical protein GGH92_006087 [Coemansia sp. RSA 2673]
MPSQRFDTLTHSSVHSTPSSTHQTRPPHQARPTHHQVHPAATSKHGKGDAGLKKIRNPRLLQQAEVDKRLKALHRRARWLDSRFSCFCGMLRFGVESLVGLIPIIGDFAGVFLAVTYMNTIRRRFDVPPSIVSQMTINIAIDFCVGLVPILGDLVDTLFKANMRNYALVENYVLQQRKAAQDLEVGGGGGGEGLQEPRPGYFPDLPLRLNAKSAAKAVAMSRR